MRILLISAYFPPDTGSASNLFYELGGALVEEGHSVSVLTTFPSYHARGDLSRYRGERWLEETMAGMRVFRVRIPRFFADVPVARGIWQFILAIRFTNMLHRLPPQDVSLVYSPPITLALPAWRLKQRKKTPFVLNVQDLLPQSVIDLGILRNRFLIHMLERFEKWSYRKADLITVHSAGNKQHIATKGVAEEKVRVVPIWIDTDYIKPGERLNEFRRVHELGTAFIVSFAGVLGVSQDLDIVLEAAALLKGEKNILFLIVGDGTEKSRLEGKKQKLHLTNVKFLPMQPYAIYPEILAASDASLATLKKEVKTPVVPSKIISIMAAGRPVIAAMNLQGDAPQLIEGAHAGFVIPPEDHRRLSETILKLYHNESLRKELGAHGRRYVEAHLTLKQWARHYVDLFQSLVV